MHELAAAGSATPCRMSTKPLVRIVHDKPDVGRVLLADLCRPTRVLIAVHSSQRGGAQLVALGQARALRREYDLLVAVGAGPLHAAFAENTTAVFRGPSPCRSGGPRAAGGRCRSAAQCRTPLRLPGSCCRHRIDVVVVNSTVLAAPVLGARLAQVPVIVYAQEAPRSAAAQAPVPPASERWRTRFSRSRRGLREAFGRRARECARGSRSASPVRPIRRLVSCSPPIPCVSWWSAPLDRHKRQDLAVATGPCAARPGAGGRTDASSARRPIPSTPPRSVTKRTSSE